MPSKLYGIMAVGRPAIFVGTGELADFVREHGIGVAVEPGDAAGLARAIRALASDRRQTEEMGRRGRALYEERFAPEVALAHWERILKEAAQ